jgi:hypothetical protein
VSVALLAARAPKAPVPGYPASLLIRDSGPWTLRLAQASRVKGGLEVEAPGTRAVLEHPLDAAQIVPNQVHTLQFRPRTPGGASGFDLELAAGPDSLYQGAKLVFHVEGMRRLRGLKTSNEHWVAAGTNGTPQVTWGLQLARAKDDLLRLLEFN